MTDATRNDHEFPRSCETPIHSIAAPRAQPKRVRATFI